MKFINVKTGLICEPHNAMVIEQMKKSDAFKELEEKAENKETKAEETEVIKTERKRKK